VSRVVVGIEGSRVGLVMCAGGVVFRGALGALLGDFLGAALGVASTRGRSGLGMDLGTGMAPILPGMFQRASFNNSLSVSTGWSEHTLRTNQLV
jgi:hypothetical protein